MPITAVNSLVLSPSLSSTPSALPPPTRPLSPLDRVKLDQRCVSVAFFFLLLILVIIFFSAKVCDLGVARDGFLTVSGAASDGTEDREEPR